jgi:hypothetical protein
MTKSGHPENDKPKPAYLNRFGMETDEVIIESDAGCLLVTYIGHDGDADDGAFHILAAEGSKSVRVQVRRRDLRVFSQLIGNLVVRSFKFPY